MKFLYSFVATRIVSLDGNTFGNLLPREFFTNSGPVDNAEKAFFVVNTRRQRGPCVTTKPWNILTNISVQTTMPYSWKIYRKYRKL